MSIYRQFLFELRYIPHILHLVTDFKQKSSRQFRSTAYLVFSTPAEARTLDTLIKSQVLYQLSYGCIIFCFVSALLLNCGCKGTTIF